MTFPRLSHPDKEGPLNVSKWLKHQLLISEGEMQEFLDLLDPYIFITSEIVTKETALVSKARFLEAHRGYVETLRQGKLPDETSIRSTFSAIFTKQPDIVYAMALSEDRFLIKAIRPVIQLQMHQFFFSKIDNKIHPMVLGKDSIFWGIQISYPQVYQDPQTRDFFKVINSSEFPNTDTFTLGAKWLRRKTIPTPFIYEGTRINSSIRLGKECLPWINEHPQLVSQGITIWKSK